jgi:Domain of unknown function (DUF4920)
MKSFCVAILSVAAVAFAGEQKLGKPLEQTESISLAKLFADPAPLVGKTVQVKAKITEVCQMMGCWMNLTDDQGHLLRIKVEDGDIVFPKDSIGKTAIAEGKLEKQELSREQLISEGQHEAEESGRKFDPSTVKSGRTVYLIAGSGAVIFEK